MAEYYVGSVTLTTSDGATVAVTGVGFQPKVVLFWYAGETYAGSVTGRRGFMFGATSGSGQNAAVLGAARDSWATDAWSYGVVSSNYCITLRAVSGAAGAQYSLSSFDSDGFTLSKTNPTVVGSVTINYMAIGGSDVSARVGVLACGTNNSNVSTTAPGFQPNFLMLGSARQTNTTTDANVGYATGISVGATDGTTTVAMGWSRDQSSTSVCRSELHTNHLNRIHSQFGGESRTLVYSSFDANGFTVTPGGADTNATLFMYVALILPDVALGTDTLETTITTFGQSGLGFDPGAVMLACAPTVTTLNTDDTSVAATVSMAATDGANEHWSTWYVQDNASACDVFFAQGTGQLITGYQRDGDDSFSVNSVASLSSLGTGAFTLSQDDAAPSASQLWWIAFGAGSAGGGGNPSTRRLQSLGRGVVSEASAQLGGVLEY